MTRRAVGPFALAALIWASRVKVAAMSPEELRAMLAAQARSAARAEAGFGTDADEAAHRAALASGDPGRIAACEAAEAVRLATFDAAPKDTP